MTEQQITHKAVCNHSTEELAVRWDVHPAGFSEQCIARLREEASGATSRPQLQLSPNPHNCCKNSFFMALRPMSPFPDWLPGKRGSPTPYHPTPPSVFKPGTWVPPTLCISGFPFCNQTEKTSPKRLLPQGQAHPGPLLVLQPTVPFDVTWTWGWHLSRVPTPATAGGMCTLHMAMEIWGSILDRCLQ